MSYSCTDFTDSILDALNIEVPAGSADSPSDQADAALAVIEALKALPGATEAIAKALSDHGWPLDWDGDTDSYRCIPCDEEWSDTWSCQCDDECPKCEADYSPYESVDLRKGAVQ